MKNQRDDEITHEALCAYVLGEADAAEVARIERALESSEELRAQHEALSATIGLVQATCDGEASLAPELVARLESAARPASRPNPWYFATPVRMAAGLTALAAGVLAGRALMDGTERPGAVATEVAQLDEAPASSEQPEEEAEELDSSWRGMVEDSTAPGLVDEPVSVDLLEADVEPPSVAGELVVADREVAQAPVTETVSEERARQKSAAAAPTGSPDPSAEPAEKAKDSFFLGSAAGSDKSGSGKLAKLERKLAEQQAAPPRGGGGGGGPAYGSPSGPSSPGPAGPSRPGPSGAPSTQRPSLRLQVGSVAGNRVDAKVPEVQLRYEALQSLGYVGDDDEDVRLLDESTDYFLDAGRRGEALTPEAVDAMCRERVQVILRSCRRLPGERPRDMFFRYWGDNPFELSRLDAQSTFSVDVDTASYALARRYLTDGMLPEKAQIRTEEFVNYFKPDVPAPTQETFAVHTELTPSRFGASPDAESQRYMMRVVVRGREVAAEERGPLALTFVVDVSGSMREGGRLELVKHSLRLLAAQLDGNDSMSIVAFSNEARVVLPMTSAANRGLIEAAVYGLQPDGGTNAEAGLRMGYEMAATALTSGVQNRVVLLSDGVANVGQTDQDRINSDVRSRREAGIYLNTIGVGMNNHNDVFLEQLADKGDGVCNYVDSAVEARRALVENFTGAFQPIARDVKIQVEFDPSQVTRYRLLGYENRAIADADFRNDAVDAGEVGAGHQVVALYELELAGTGGEGPLAEVRLRWKAPTGAGRDPLEDSATERAFAVSEASLTSFEGASAGYKRSVFVAQFAEILRRSVHARGDSLDELIAESTRLAPQLGDPDFDELVAMMQKSRALILKHAPRHDTLTTCIDSLRRNEILRAQYDELRQSKNDEVLAELERQNRELEARIEELIRGELEAKLK